jgi:hypothetical protein
MIRKVCDSDRSQGWQEDRGSSELWFTDMMDYYAPSYCWSNPFWGGCSWEWRSGMTSSSKW